MGNIIVLVILIIIFGSAFFKIHKDKKNNVKCAGCPSSKSCHMNNK